MEKLRDKVIYSLETTATQDYETIKKVISNHISNLDYLDKLIFAESNVMVMNYFVVAKFGPLHARSKASYHVLHVNNVPVSNLTDEFIQQLKDSAFVELEKQLSELLELLKGVE